MGEHDTYTDFDDAISEHLFHFDYIWCRTSGRFVLQNAGAAKPQNRVMLGSSFIGSISVMTKSESTSFGRSSAGDGAGACGDRRFRIVYLLIKFAQGNFIILDILRRIIRRNHFSQLKVTLFE